MKSPAAGLILVFLSWAASEDADDGRIHFSDSEQQDERYNFDRELCMESLDSSVAWLVDSFVMESFQSPLKTQRKSCWYDSWISSLEKVLIW